MTASPQSSSSSIDPHAYCRLRFDEAAEEAIENLANVLQWHRNSQHEGTFVAQKDGRAGASKKHTVRVIFSFLSIFVSSRVVEIRLEMMRIGIVRQPSRCWTTTTTTTFGGWSRFRRRSRFWVEERPSFFFPSSRVAEEEAFGHNGRDVGSRIVSNRSASKRLAGKRE